MGRGNFAQRGKSDYSMGSADADIMGIFDSIAKAKSIAIDSITIDPALQVRVDGLNEGTVQNYMAVLENGDTLPAIVVFRLPDGGLLLSSGFHRIEAHKRLGLVEIAAEIREGTRQDAIRFAFEDNKSHGLPLSNKDKKAYMLARLEDEMWSQIGNREIARQLGISHVTVMRWIEEHNSTGTNVPVTRTQVVGADGRTYNTEKIRQANHAREENVPPAAPVEPMPETPAGQRRQVAYLVERLEKLDQRIHNAKVAGDEKRVKELEEHKQNIEAHLKRVEAVKFLTPDPSPLVGEGRPDGPPYVSIDDVMAGEHMRESDLSKALRVIREMDGLLDTLVELLNASGGDWEESGQADVLRNFRAFVNGCGELLGNMKKVWG